MDFCSQDSTAQSLIRAFSQFRKIDWNKETINNLKPSEIQVLICIMWQGKEKDMTVSDISKLLHVTSPTVTQIINRLDEYGFVERQINKDDRRSIKVSLTDEGHKTAELATEKYADSINGLIAFLGEQESKQLIELLDKVFIYYKDSKRV